MNNEEQTFIDSLPETITVDESFARKKPGRPTTVAARRKSQPVKGKVQGKRNHFTDKEKLNCVCVYAVTGNARRTAEITKIPEGTIRSWKSTVWWQEASARVHQEKDEEINSKLTQMIDKAVEAVNDRIDNGDYIYDARNQQIIRVPVKAKDLTIVTAIGIDKRNLLRGQPTQRIEKVSVDDHLQKLQDKFKQFMLAKEVEHEGLQIEEAQFEEFQEDVPDGEEVEGFEELSEEIETLDQDDLTINEMFSE
jgi:hypothetical protein